MPIKYKIVRRLPSGELTSAMVSGECAITYVEVGQLPPTALCPTIGDIDYDGWSKGTRAYKSVQLLRPARLLDGVK